MRRLFVLFLFTACSSSSVETTDGEWSITRAFSTPCQVAWDDFDQLAVRIDGDAVTVLSSDMSLWSARVYDTDEHRRVEMTIDEIWQHDPSIQLPPFSVQVTYDLELTPIAELEGSAGYQFLVDAPQGGGTSCESTGTASGVRVTD